MEFKQQEIIKSQKIDTVIIFNKDDDNYTVYSENEEISEYLNTNFFTEHKRKIDLNRGQYEMTVKFILQKVKLNIKEYKNTQGDLYILEKEGFPYDWSNYLDILNDEFVSPICSVLCDKSMVYVAFFDFLDQYVYYLSFIDDDIYSNLYSLMTEINVFEVVISDLKLEKTLMNMGLNVNMLKNKNTFNISLDIEDIYMKKVVTNLIVYLNIKNYKIKEYKKTNFMKIDQKTLQNLDVNSLIKIIQPKTIQGKRLLDQFIRQPLTNKQEIEKRYDYVETFYNFNSNLLIGFPDLIKYSRKILKLKINEIIIVYKSLSVVREIINHLQNLNSEFINSDFVIPLTNLSNTFEQLKLEINKIIDFEKFEINSNVSEIIHDLKQEQEKIKSEINEEHERVLKINKKIKIESRTNNQILFKVPRSEFKIFKENHFVEKTILKGGIIFTTKNLEELNIKYEQISKEYVIEERKILDNFLILLNNYNDSLDVINYIISLIDVYCAFSKTIDFNFTKPKIVDYFCIKNAFHPIVKECIKNSVSLGLNENKRFCVITGPNMGGKSTFLKLCAIINLLAQIGCFIPCEEGFLPTIDGIFVRIGANDISSKGLSTFMVEMNDIARICNNVTNNSLIIIDELGRGTSAIDGLSLAMSIKEFLIEKNCYTFFATHFPELCGEDVLNKRMACQLNENGLTLLYKLEDGICNASLGVECAQHAGFPSEIVEFAKELLNN